MELVNRMRTKLAKDTSQSQSEGWDALWKDGVTPWDLGEPSPVLQSELAATSFRRKRLCSLVPGCGSGHDLLAIAQYQNDLLATGAIQKSRVVGLDISLTSLQTASELVKRNWPDPSHSSTRIDLCKGDFFDVPTTWQTVQSSSLANPQKEETATMDESTFDFIFDHVFFCALPPHLRLAWGEAISKLLQPTTGRILTLMFPYISADAAVGPPYPVTPLDYQQALEPYGISMDHPPRESPDSVASRKGKELVCWWSR